MEFNIAKYPWVSIIIGIIVSIILFSAFSYQEIPTPIQFTISESAFYDPICDDKQIFSIDYSFYCLPHETPGESLGSSTNIDDVADVYDSHLTILFLKIPLSQLPVPNGLYENSIINAKLILRTIEDKNNISHANTEFAVWYGLCHISSWKNTTSMLELPCVDEKKIDVKKEKFSVFKKASLWETAEIDIKEHVEYAQENNLEIFTELITFYPRPFFQLKFNSEQRDCLYNDVEYFSDMFKCVGTNLIAVYNVYHPMEDLRPKVVIEYTQIPTFAGRILQTALIFFPGLVAIIPTMYFQRRLRKEEQGKELVDNVYRPSFNIMKNIFDKRHFITEIPPNPWEKLEHYWKLRTEPDVKKLFEQYTNELDKWHKVWVDYGNALQKHEKELGKIILSAFEKAGLTNKSNDIILTETSHISPKDWIRQFADIIFENEFKNSEELCNKLIEHEKFGHRKFFENWKKNKPEIFQYVFELLPQLVQSLKTEFSRIERQKHRELLKISIEALTFALEDRLNKK